MPNQDQLNQMSMEKMKLEQKLEKERGEKVAREFVAELERMDKPALEAKLLEYSKTAQGLINTKNADETLASLKAQVSEQSKTHNDGIKRNKDHQRLVSIIISEKYGDQLMDLKETKETSEEEE